MTVPTERLLRHVRRLASPARGEGGTDAALLGRFVRGRDEDAFAALVARHGPMVLSVCRRVQASPTPRHVDQVRAVAALEYAGTREARRLLGYLARGVPDARLTQEARASM
jgi:hypothetical protein